MKGIYENTHVKEALLKYNEININNNNVVDSMYKNNSFFFKEKNLHSLLNKNNCYNTDNCYDTKLFNEGDNLKKKLFSNLNTSKLYCTLYSNNENIVSKSYNSNTCSNQNELNLNNLINNNLENNTSDSYSIKDKQISNKTPKNIYYFNTPSSYISNNNETCNSLTEKSLQSNNKFPDKDAKKQDTSGKIKILSTNDNKSSKINNLIIDLNIPTSSTYICKDVYSNIENNNIDNHKSMSSKKPISEISNKLINNLCDDKSTNNIVKNYNSQRVPLYSKLNLKLEDNSTYNESLTSDKSLNEIPDFVYKLFDSKLKSNKKFSYNSNLSNTIVKFSSTQNKNNNTLFNSNKDTEWEQYLKKTNPEEFNSLFNSCN